jgi:pyrroline-5-carboxylate reductase
MRIAIVGVGNLGSALAKSLVGHGVSREAIVVVTRDAKNSADIHERTGFLPQPLPPLGDDDVLIVAVKPQDFEAASESIRPALVKGTVVVSMMAGISCATLQERLQHSAVARAMPNLGAGVRESATAFFISEQCSAAQVARVDNVIFSCGRGWRVEQEQLIDVATAVAGSGPAYLCWLGEQMEEVAREQGIPSADAHALVLQTLKGAVAYLEHDGATFSELRSRVTSPNGTTAAALAVLGDQGADKVLREAIRAAARRAVELGKPGV